MRSIRFWGMATRPNTDDPQNTRGHAAGAPHVYVGGMSDLDSPRLDPIQGVLEILRRASMTGTNKLGLLLTLLDLAPEKVRGNVRISKKEIAARYLEIHWEHGRPYGNTALRQTSAIKRRKDNTVSTDTTVMQEVHELRRLLRETERGDLRDRSLDVVKNYMAGTEWNDDWERALDKSLARVEKSLWKNPVRLLQKLPGDPDPFLFEFSAGHPDIAFLPGVAEDLTRFSGVLRPLVEFRFSELVAAINRDTITSPEHDIHTHLFGRDRIMPPDGIRRGLLKLQGRRCLLTDRRIRPSSSSLDHVIPWSRTRVSQIENFLMTTPSVNSSKADSLLGPVLVKKWMNHVTDQALAIQSLAQNYNWPTDLDRVRRVALHTYEALDPSTGVWNGTTGVQPLGEHGKATILKILS